MNTYLYMHDHLTGKTTLLTAHDERLVPVRHKQMIDFVIEEMCLTVIRDNDGLMSSNLDPKDWPELLYEFYGTKRGPRAICVRKVAGNHLSTFLILERPII